jgi:hypothetical protein
MLDHLAMFTGTDNWYRHQSGLLYTDGVQYLAEEAKAYWLLDAIGSYQNQLRKRGGMFAEFQLWTLNVATNKAATLECRGDSNLPPIITQVIEYTDFPLATFKLYVEGNVLLLPSEH